ncbi:MAG: TonB-dependent receptor [Cryomorphaceae bacterium]|nr:TonB-dependent receptor [Cryomorphaceae bacterium]
MRQTDLIRVQKIALVLLLFSHASFAQPIRQDSLDEVVVLADRIRLSGSDALIETIDENRRAAIPPLFLSDVLLWNSHWSMLSYGPGMVTTAAHRGNNAEQVRVYWKGIPLNHPALGMFDFSTVPAVLFGQISLLQTGSSAQMGNGSLGGSVLLNENPNVQNIKIHNSIGSFGFRQQMAAVGFSHKKLSGSTKLLWMRSDNDYLYQPLHGDRRPLPNADYQQKHVLQTLKYEFSEKISVEAAFWWMDKHNNIPPTVNANPRQRAALHDRNIFSALSYQQRFNKNSGMLVQYGYATANQTFTQSFPDINSFNPARTHFAEHHIFDQQGKFSYKVGQQFTYSEAPGPNLSADNYQRFYSLFGQVKYDVSNRLNSQLSLRREWVNGFDPPLSFAFLQQYLPTEKQMVWLRFSRNYRVPTLNHLYWEPVGNPDLLPENNFLAEIGWNIQGKNIKTGITFYGSETENYIQWRPSVGQFWAASNVKEVLAYGTELQLDGNWKVSESRIFGGNLRAAFGRAYGISGEDIHRGNQLIYQPVYRGSVLLFYAISDWRLTMRGRYMSEMFAYPDHHWSTQIPDVFLFSGGVERTFSFSDTQLQTTLFLENIGNQSYEFQLGRPMPGFHFVFSANVTLPVKSKPEKKSLTKL